MHDTPQVQPDPPADADRLGLDALSEALRLSFRMLRLLMLAVFVGYLATGIYVVQQHEKALVLHFGKVAGMGEDRVKAPGLHWTWPRPISEIVKVPTERVMSLSSDTFWTGADELNQPDVAPPRLVPGKDGYTLSGDANLLHSKWAVRYTVLDPERYALHWKDSTDVLEHALHQAVVHVSAGSPIDAMIRTGIEAFRAEVENRLRDWADTVDLGLRIQGVDLVAPAPPLQVGDAFLQVVRSEQTKYQLISDAQNFSNTSLNEAKGEARRLVAMAEADKDRIVREVKSNVDYFEQVRAKYEKSPRIIAQALLQDTLRRTLDNVDEKFIVDSGDQEVRITLGTEGSRKRKGDQ